MEGQQPPAQETGTLEEIQKKYAESSTEGKRLAARVKQLEETNRQLELRSTPQVDPDEAALEESGIDPGVLRRFVSRQVGDDTARQLRPLFNTVAAEQLIPADVRPKAQAILASNPDVAETYQALVAAERTQQAANFLSGMVRMHDAEAGMNEEDAANKVKREEARRDAALPTSQSGRGTTDDQEAEQAAERRQKLREVAQQVGGYNKAIASEFFKGRIKVIDRLDEPPRVI